MNQICLDRQRYVIAVKNWRGKISLRQRELELEDARSLAAWLSRESKKGST